MDNYKIKKMNSLNNNIDELQDINNNKDKYEVKNKKKMENGFINKNRENFKNFSNFYEVISNTVPNSRAANDIFKNFSQYNKQVFNNNEIENNIIDILNINIEEQKNNDILNLNLTKPEEGNKKKNFNF